MSILEYKGNKYKVNGSVEFKNGEPIIDGEHFESHEIITKSCKCIDSCKR